MCAELCCSGEIYMFSQDGNLPCHSESHVNLLSYSPLVGLHPEKVRSVAVSVLVWRTNVKMLPSAVVSLKMSCIVASLPYGKIETSQPYIQFSVYFKAGVVGV